MNLFISFDKTAQPEAAVRLSNIFFGEMMGRDVRYQDQEITDNALVWLVTASDAASVKTRIEAIVGDQAIVTAPTDSGLVVTPR